MPATPLIKSVDEPQKQSMLETIKEDSFDEENWDNNKQNNVSLLIFHCEINQYWINLQIQDEI